MHSNAYNSLALEPCSCSWSPPLREACTSSSCSLFMLSTSRSLRALRTAPQNVHSHTLVSLLISETNNTDFSFIGSTRQRPVLTATLTKETRPGFVAVRQDGASNEKEDKAEDYERHNKTVEGNFGASARINAAPKSFQTVGASLGLVACLVISSRPPNSPRVVLGSRTRFHPRRF